jgi:hypothetical protein
MRFDLKLESRPIMERICRIAEDHGRDERDCAIPKIAALLRDWWRVYGKNPAKKQLYLDARLVFASTKIMQQQGIEKGQRTVNAALRRCRFKSIPGGKRAPRQNQI